MGGGGSLPVPASGATHMPRSSSYMPSNGLGVFCSPARCGNAGIGARGSAGPGPAREAATASAPGALATQAGHLGVPAPACAFRRPLEADLVRADAASAWAPSLSPDSYIRDTMANSWVPSILKNRWVCGKSFVAESWAATPPAHRWWAQAMLTYMVHFLVTDSQRTIPSTDESLPTQLEISPPESQSTPCTT